MELLTKYEIPLWERGIEYIAGIDEVGRGALAGPLVVGAVILNPSHLLRNYDVASELLETYGQIKDSKLISAKKRERLAVFIKQHAISYSIEQITPAIIDSEGITGATQIAFFRAIKNLSTKAQHVLTDTFEIKKLTQQNQTNIVSGDKLSVSIAAASIIAKVFRDDLMVNLHNKVEKYQKYHFHKHKGYGTKLHKDMISEHGPCDIHRKCFEPIKSLLNSQ